MPDTWSDESEPRRKDPLRASAMRELVERALQRELALRRELRPHAQLAVSPRAAPSAVDEAYARLQQRYNPDAFAEYGDEAVLAARSIVELLRSAHRRMREPIAADGDDSTTEPLLPLESRPRGDETHRALETLRLAIARRIAEAEQHRDAGRLSDAIRVFESVVILDRNNEVARLALCELRVQAAPAKQTVVDRMLSRLLRRRA
jgi:hypothetical protein